jgi:predicted metal-binding membrane protein
MVDQARDVRTRSLTITLSIAAACWAVSVTQMRGMDMGVATRLGSFWFFVGVWTAMMAAMMLPGAALAVSRHARARQRLGSALTFVAAYVGLWTLFGVAAYTIYRPHGTFSAGIIAVAAGLYELTPTKRRARQRCQQSVRSGFQLGQHCIRSSIGLMFLLLALGVMSVAWMSVTALVVLLQKLLPPHRAADGALAVAVVVFGVLILIVPSSVPGLSPTM